LRLVSDLSHDLIFADLPVPVSALRRRLELTPLIRALMAREKGMAAEAAAFDLADSLATLMDEMHGEGVLPDALARIDVADHSAHWQRSQRFLQIIAQFFQVDAAPDQQAFQRLLAERLAERWQTAAPQDPVIIAGSTGSRGTTRLLMNAVAHLPQGVLVLPGFDFDTPPDVWAAMADARTGEDHPQFRYCRLMADLGLTTVGPWVGQSGPVPARNRLISLSLRPAPVTDQWMVEGRLLQDMAVATAGITLLEAPTPRAEAVSIALMMRAAVLQGKRAALITPDRQLSRCVTAVLDGWHIVPDDSAGEPLALTPPGRFLRMVAALFGQPVTGEALLALIKHPVTASGAERGLHLRHALALEMKIREKGVAFPDAAFLRDWALEHAGKETAIWAHWLAGLLDGLAHVGTQPLSQYLAQHLSLAEAFAMGPGGTDTAELWALAAGLSAKKAMVGLVADADVAGDVTATQFGDVLRSVLQQGDVRKQGQTHPDVMIWGTREARIQGADIVILGGLNDGIWPAAPPADPWLNRDMRLQVGLLLPERRIGLSAHDYQQAVCAAEVVITRAKRDAQAETVASRWLNRLTNLLAGLPDQGGPQALAGMVARGKDWLDLAAAMDRPDRTMPLAKRPAPCPPVAQRPKQLSVTAIQTLMRDPYDIYAGHILGLLPLAPLRPAPDPKLRGQILHRILEVFVRNRRADTDPRSQLMAAADGILAEDVAWPTTRALWRARLARAAGFFLDEDAQHGGRPVLLEEKKVLDIPALGFRLVAKPDRIDVLPDGRLRVIDYKTGALPTNAQQKVFDIQLLLAACMAERGAFGPHLPTEVASIVYIGLGASPSVLETLITPDLTAAAWANLERLLLAYAQPGQGYASRRALVKEGDFGRYDHLARFGEWTMTDPAVPVIVGEGS
jgi:ATP-dependent helicase/nuclease subunit B